MKIFEEYAHWVSVMIGGLTVGAGISVAMWLLWDTGGSGPQKIEFEGGGLGAYTSSITLKGLPAIDSGFSASPNLAGLAVDGSTTDSTPLEDRITLEVTTLKDALPSPVSRERTSLTDRVTLEITRLQTAPPPPGGGGTSERASMAEFVTYEVRDADGNLK